MHQSQIPVHLSHLRRRPKVGQGEVALASWQKVLIAPHLEEPLLFPDMEAFVEVMGGITE